MTIRRHAACRYAFDALMPALNTRYYAMLPLLILYATLRRITPLTFCYAIADAIFHAIFDAAATDADD